MNNTLENMRRKIVSGERLDGDDAKELYRRIMQHIRHCDKCLGEGIYTKRNKKGHAIEHDVPCPRCAPLRDK